MRLLDLDLRDFRNIEKARLDLGPKATVIVGPNGHGKTNLLEAIYLLATLRPLRTNRLAELQRFGVGSCAVEGRYELGATIRTFTVRIESGARQALVDGKRVRDLEEYFGGVSVVSFTPDDLAVVKGGPEGRRRYLDRAVFNRFPAFLKESREYGRALRARNRLLREAAADAMLEAFDEPLCRLGARIVSRRRALLEELVPGFEQVLAELSRGELVGSIQYSTRGIEEAADEAGYADKLGEALHTKRESDRQRGYTSVGPHADSLGIKLGGKPARAYASQGQQRAIILALKIAEIENLRSSHGYQPLLLLDDVSSELDRERNAQLMSYLASVEGQVIITTTDPEALRAAAGPDAAFFQVREGSFSPLVGKEASNT